MQEFAGSDLYRAVSNRRRRLMWALLAAAFLLPGSAAAQEQGDSAAARFRLGPIAVAPRMVLRNMGIDTNVFNDAGEPQQDFVATVGADVDTWWRVGRARLTGTTRFDLVHFSRYNSQSTVNGAQQLRAELPLNRLMPYASASVSRTRERPNLEIDVRIPQVASDAAIGTRLRLTGRLVLDIGTAHSTINYAATTDSFSALRDALNNRTIRRQTAVRYAVTPLTTIVIGADRQSHRFLYSKERDAESVSVTPAVEFKRFALIAGKASVGYRRFRLISERAPSFAGVVAGVDLSYTLLGDTRFGARVHRDVGFSYEATQPYYVVTGIATSMERRLIGASDIVGRVSRETLAYRNLTTVPQTQDSSRLDVIQSYGGGLGYRLGRDRRIGAGVDYVRRRSPITNRSYEGLRFGISVTYPL